MQNPPYDFVPYKYGAFSFTANSDLTGLVRENELEEAESDWIWKGKSSMFSELKPADQTRVKNLMTAFGPMSTNDLVRFTYQEYPWFAQNSVIRDKVLAPDANEPLPERGSGEFFYTIGYEGRSLEKYMNILIEADVKVLCDVRRNAFSMKYGFNKSQLAMACEGTGIKYFHLPQFGISSADRKSLDSPQAYQDLFEKYDSNLSARKPELGYFREMMDQERRVAITCFEADECNCHRGRLAKHLIASEGWKWSVKHL